MCHKYGGKRTPPYVRLCYLTGRMGEHLPLTDEQAADFYWGMFHRHGDYSVVPNKRRGSNGKSSRSRAVFSTWWLNGANEEVVAENARYLAARYTIDHEAQRVVFYHEKGISQSMKDRVLSFGLTEWVADHYRNRN